jgi:hypothetical protein
MQQSLPGFNPISAATSRGLWEWLWGYSDHQGASSLLRLRDKCVLLDPFGDFPSITNNARPTQRGAAAATRRRHGLEVEDEGLLKDLVIIFVFLEVLCTVRCFF